MRYQHKKGKIQDNAIHALLHDPLFAMRIEKKRKGKGSYSRQQKHASQRCNEDGQVYAGRELGHPHCCLTLIFQ